MERELKYSLTEDYFPSAAELRVVFGPGAFDIGQPSTSKQHDRYFDDARSSLSRAGLALRQRTVGGERLATLKTRGSVKSAYHVREEIELPIGNENQLWPEPILERVSAVTAPAALRAQIDLDTERLRYAVTRRGRVVATLSFDTVTVEPSHGDQRVVFNEVEVEAVGETDEATLEEIAALLDQVTQLTPNSSSKLERALALLSLGESLDD
jgi:inorganic triphosphatase YgiF